MHEDRDVLRLRRRRIDKTKPPVRVGVNQVSEGQAAVPAVRAPGSTWLLLTTNAEFIERTPGLPDMGPPDPRRIIWTDDFSSLISVLR